MHCGDYWKEFYSSNHATLSYRPKLEIIAEDTSGYSYQTIGYKAATKSVTYYDGLSNSALSTEFQWAANSWWYSGAGVSVGITGVYNYFWRVLKAGDDATLPSLPNGATGRNRFLVDNPSNPSEITASIIEINTAHALFSSSTAYRNSIARQSTFTHELGHTFGLDERDPNKENQNPWSVMSYSKDHHIVVLPSRRDIDDVIINYS